MKSSQLLFAIIISAILFSCNSSSSIGKEKTSDNGTATIEGSNIISFKVNGEQVISSGWTISRFTQSSDPSHEWLNITSNMKEDKRTININLNGTMQGTYSFVSAVSTSKGSHGAFYPDYLGDLTKSFSFSKGSFIITDVNTKNKTVNGTFSGTVQNLRGDKMEITEGKIINGVLNPDVIHY